MTIATYADLKTQLTSYLNRSDYTGQYGLWTQLAEARMMYGSQETGMESLPLRVRSMETAVDLTVNAQTVALSTGYLAARRLYLNTLPVAELEYIVPDVFWRNWIGCTSAQPQQFTIEGENIVFGPSPDTSYTGKFLYYKKITGLSGDTDTNTILTSTPQIYLYGVLTEAFSQLRNMDKAVAANARFVGAVNALQAQDKRDRYSGSPWMARVDTGQP